MITLALGNWINRYLAALSNRFSWFPAFALFSWLGYPFTYALTEVLYYFWVSEQKECFRKVALFHYRHVPDFWSTVMRFKVLSGKTIALLLLLLIAPCAKAQDAVRIFQAEDHPRHFYQSPIFWTAMFVSEASALADYESSQHAFRSGAGELNPFFGQVRPSLHRMVIMDLPFEFGPNLAAYEVFGRSSHKALKALAFIPCGVSAWKHGHEVVHNLPAN